MWARRINRRWKIFLIGLIAVICFKLYRSRYLWPSIAELTELDKCPACFGTSLCPAFLEGLVSLSGFSSISGFINLIGSKNIFFALYENKKVILKKLGHNWELEKLDKLLCGDIDNCVVSEAVSRVNDARTAIVNYLSPYKNQYSTSLNSLHLCPSVSNLDLLLSNVFMKSKDVIPSILYMNIWTLLLHNAEPLILQILPEEEGWPVPKYYGACGRIVMEEYVGNMLSSYQYASWYIRAKLAHQLLIAAGYFTDKHPHFRFYLTDVSMDNVAVDKTGSVKFIDLENVIIVDKNIPEKEKPVSWNTPHVSEDYECENCFAFSSDEICSHQISDHNYFAICQLLASNEGLLHDPPENVLRQHPELPDMLRECIQPSELTGRFSVAKELTMLLANISSDVKI